MNMDMHALLVLGAQGLFYILLLTCIVHALFLFYHWFAYGTTKNVAFIALAFYLSGSACCFLIMAVSLSKW